MSVEEHDERQLVEELKTLRRGHGLLAKELKIEDLPRLRRLCGIEPGTPVGARRELLVTRISSEVRRLPDDMCLAVQAAFALEPASRKRFLNERMAWLGEQIDRDPRTAIRRVEEGLALLAERLLTGPVEDDPPQNEYAPDGWYVNRLRSIVMLHLEPVQLHEHREITSTRDGLEEITVSWSVPDDASGALSELGVEMLYGGELQPDIARSTPTYWTGDVRLPRPLAAGERHEYQVRVTSLPRLRMRPYYVLTPFRRFDEFVLRAKFDPGSAPSPIWRLSGVPFQTLEHREPGSDILTLNSVGEIEVTFRNLRHGLSYGLGWRNVTDHDV